MPSLTPDTDRPIKVRLYRLGKYLTIYMTKSEFEELEERRRVYAESVRAKGEVLVLKLDDAVIIDNRESITIHGAVTELVVPYRLKSPVPCGRFGTPSEKIEKCILERVEPEWDGPNHFAPPNQQAPGA